MSSNAHSDRSALDLERDVPTTADDVRVLRQLRRQVPSWLLLSAEELDAVLRMFDVRKRPPMRSDPTPFSLDDDLPSRDNGFQPPLV